MEAGSSKSDFLTGDAAAGVAEEQSRGEFKRGGGGVLLSAASTTATTFRYQCRFRDTTGHAETLGVIIAVNTQQFIRGKRTIPSLQVFL